MKTFEAIIDGDRIRWASEDPHLTGPTPAKVEIIEEIELTDGKVLADVIAEIVARRGGVTSFGDAAAWQRETREADDSAGTRE